MTDAEIENRLRKVARSDCRGTFAAGTLFGDWRISAFIARGGTSEVYCAEHVTLGTSAAVKVLVDAVKAERRERFRGEAKLLAELKSSSFPRFFAYGEANGTPYLVEELLEPRDLPKGDAASARYLLAISNGVAELHARGVVHRDLKPANILFREGGEPVIVDLGLSSGTGVSSSGGTIGYSAPEQFIGGEVTPAADIHALGVLAERMGTGWKTIIRRATSSIPSERYQSVQAFARAVRRRNWERNFIRTIVGVLIGSILIAIASWSIDSASHEIHLNGQTLVRDRPIVIGPNRVYKVFGPGTLDAKIEGHESSKLWMTNCVVLNRAKAIFPEVGLKYEMTAGVYLNFINVDKPIGEFRLQDYVLPYDGANNEVRFRGPDTISGLMQLKNSEYFNRLWQD